MQSVGDGGSGLQAVVGRVVDGFDVVQGHGDAKRDARSAAESGVE